MPRHARIVVPGLPHHVTQRGNRRAQVFFEDRDYRLFRNLLAEAVRKSGSEVWAYCLMPNHIHLILVPASPDGLRQSLAHPHRAYALAINTRFGWSGHLWQNRFASVAMEEPHLATALRYVSLNPVRAGLVARPEDWPWSSVPAHFAGHDDELVRVGPALSRFPRFREFLSEAVPDTAYGALRRSELSGWPLPRLGDG